MNETRVLTRTITEDTRVRVDFSGGRRCKMEKGIKRGEELDYRDKEMTAGTYRQKSTILRTLEERSALVKVGRSDCSKLGGGGGGAAKKHVIR